MSDLADIVMPVPPSWVPRTAGWLVLGVLIAIGLLWLGWHLVRRWHANRHRRAALAEVTRLQHRLGDNAGDEAGDEGGGRAAALLALAELLKRVALAEWPRDAVAPLSGAAWHRFLLCHAGPAADVVPVLAALVDDAEYRGEAVLAAWAPDQARATAEACRRWIAAYQRPAPHASP